MTDSYIHDSARLEALYHYDVLDTDPEAPFDRIADLAAHVFDAPVAMVSLIDDERQWQKSCVGIDAPELPLETSFCTHAIQSDEPLVVEDASTHPVFEDNPFVTGGPEVRFYAGAPLLTPHNQRIGTLCVFDVKPRTPNAEVISQLESMARMVVDELELRNRVRLERAEHKATKAEAQQKIEREREFLRKLFGTIPVMLAVDRPEDDEVRVNRAFRKVLGTDDAASNGDLLGTGDVSGTVQAHVDRLFDEVSEGWDDVTVHTHDDREVIGSWATLSLSDGTRLLIGTDQTQRRQLEAQLRHAQKMETVGTLAGGIAHDFNNILHAATVYLDMALEEASGQPALQELLEPIDTGLQRAEDLVSQLMTFSRQETSTTEEEVNLEAVVEETLTLADPSMPDCVRVSTSFEATCPIVGDPGQIQQVVMNLVRNAAQAMESMYEPTNASGDGAVPHVLEVSLRTVGVDAEMATHHAALSPGRYACVTVSDTGPGIDPDTREHIFEPFYTTKEVGSGTGLGLSVVHGIVQSHGGEITLFTQPGVGTTFNLYLPAVETSPVEAATAVSEASGDAPAARILLVDDDRQAVALEQQRIEQFGYAVTTCYRGDDALDEIMGTDAPYDLILSDYAMPGLNGLELTRALREHGADPPVILTSRFAAQVTKEEARKSGVDGFLHKPIGRDELRTAIVSHLSA